MTTLTRTKQMTKMLLLGLGALCVAFLLFRGMMGIIGNLGNGGGGQRVVAQPVFGEIAEPNLPSLNISAATTEISLDLVAGSFPQVESIVPVFEVASPSLSLSAQDRARAAARALGFADSPSQETAATFTWQSGGRTLSYSLSNQTFGLSTSLSSLGMTSRGSFSFNSPIAGQTSAYLQRVLTPSDIDFSKPELRFVNPQSGVFVPQPAESTTATNYAEITFHRAPLENLNFYSSRGKLGPITAIVVPAIQGSQASEPRAQSIGQDQLVSLTNNYFPINKDVSGTYPVIDGPTAFELLKSSMTRSLTSVEPVNAATQPSILRTARVSFASLVYLEPDPDNNQYVQPVWLFEGRGDSNVGEVLWTAMVPAIDGQATARLLR